MLIKSLLLFIAGLITLVAASDLKQSTGHACGRKLPDCGHGAKCYPDSHKCTDLHRCPGTCYYKNKYPECGGHGPNPPKCRINYECIDDPRIPGSCGQACDMPGICVYKKSHRCGGFAGKKCPKGLYCYDDPRDDCHRKNGGRDCIGICL